MEWYIITHVYSNNLSYCKVIVVISGVSDSVVRVFTTAQDRLASPQQTQVSGCGQLLIVINTLYSCRTSCPK